MRTTFCAAACRAAFALCFGLTLAPTGAPLAQDGQPKPGGEKECPDFFSLLDEQFRREIDNDPEVRKLSGQLENAQADEQSLRLRLGPAKQAAETDRGAAEQAKAAADQAKSAATTARQTAASSRAAADAAAKAGAPYPPGVFTTAQSDAAAARAADAASTKADTAAKTAEVKARTSQQRADGIEAALQKARARTDALKTQYDAARERALKRLEERYGPVTKPDCPPKTGTGTGQPLTPPGPVKAPSDSPDHGSVPNFKFRGEIFANVNWVSQFGAGTVVNGGRHTIVDSPGTLTGAGFALGLDMPSRMNPFGTGRDPWWSIDVGFARATGSANGSVAPGAATTGFDYIRPNPASGLVFLSHFLNGQVVYIDSERNQLDVEVLHNVKWQMTLNTMIPSTPIETSLGIGFQFRAIWDAHTINQSIINVPDVTSIINLDSSTYFIGPKIMGRAEYEMGRWEAYIGAYVAPGLAIGSGRAEQQARCPVCAASEQNVDLAVNDSFVRFAVNAGVRAWVSYAITPAVTARAFAGYDYFSHAARWQLDPGNAQLRTGSTGTFRVGVGLNLRF